MPLTLKLQQTRKRQFIIRFGISHSRRVNNVDSKEIQVLTWFPDSFSTLTIFKQTFGLKLRNQNSMQHFLLQVNGILGDRI